MQHVRHATAAGELLDEARQLPVMSFDVGRGQWFQFKLAGTAQVLLLTGALLITRTM
jgi:hypothetical protein